MFLDISVILIWTVIWNLGWALLYIICLSRLYDLALTPPAGDISPRPAMSTNRTE